MLRNDKGEFVPETGIELADNLGRAIDTLESIANDLRTDGRLQCPHHFASVVEDITHVHSRYARLEFAGRLPLVHEADEEE